MKLLKIILVVSLPLFLILGCKKSDDSSTSTSTSTLTCTVSYTAVGKVGDISSNLVTADWLKVPILQKA